MRYDKEYVAIDSDGNETQEDDLIVDFRSDVWRFKGISRIPEGPSTGRVYVSQGDFNAEYYPSVFNLTIVSRDNA